QNKSRQNCPCLGGQFESILVAKVARTKSPFEGVATSSNSVDAGPQPKNEIPDASKTGKEYRESKDSNDGGRRFGNCASLGPAAAIRYLRAGLPRLALSTLT